MKRPKPGFKAYLKTRFDDPSKFTEDMIITDSSGAKFRDIGSPHTIIIKFGLMLFVLLTFFVFNWTEDGQQLVIYSGMFFLAAHRFLRYFWTDFERVDEEGNAVEDQSLLYVKKRSDRSKACNKLIKLIGEDEDVSELIYYRYKWWQRLLIFLEVVLVFGIAFSIPAVTSDSPYSRFFSVERAAFFELTTGEGHYSYDDAIDLSDLFHAKIPLERDVETLVEAYGEARRYIDTFCQEAEITDYALSLKEGQPTYNFTFKNFRRGLLYKQAYSIMSVEISAEEDRMGINYWSYYAVEARFGPVKPPSAEIDVEKIIDLILKDTGCSKEDIGYLWVGTNFLLFNSQNIKNPGEGIWAASIKIKGEQMYYSVNIEEDTVIKEDFKW